MKVQDNGNLGLDEIDLLLHVRKNESPLTVKLLPDNFTREAYIAAWYAQQCGARISFATSGRLEYFNVNLGA
jgi:hypothetical protein